MSVKDTERYEKVADIAINNIFEAGFSSKGESRGMKSLSRVVPAPIGTELTERI